MSKPPRIATIRTPACFALAFRGIAIALVGGVVPATAQSAAPPPVPGNDGADTACNGNASGLPLALTAHFLPRIPGARTLARDPEKLQTFRTEIMREIKGKPSGRRFKLNASRSRP